MFARLFSAPVIIALLVWLSLAAGFGILRQKIYFETPMLEFGDAAANALQIDNAKHGREIYGNYSRFHIKHPGPAFFYLYAGGEILFHDWLHLTPSPGNAHLFTCMLVQALFFALALAVMAHDWPRAFLPLTLLAAAFYFRVLDGAFISIWPPHVLLMPFLCFMAASVSFAIGRVSILPLVVLCGGLLVHGHVAQPLFVGGLGAVALLLHVWHTQNSFRWSAWRRAFAGVRRPAMWSAAIAALFLLPIAIDVITLGKESNVAAILGRAHANESDHKSIFKSLLYLFTFAVPYFGQQESILDRLSDTTEVFFRQNWGWFAGWVVLIGALATLVPAFRAAFTMEQRRFFVASGLLLAAAAVLCVYWGVSMAGPMFQFNGYFYYALYFFLLTLLIAMTSVAIGNRLPQPITGVLAMAGAIAAFVFFFRPFQIVPADPHSLEWKRAVHQALESDPTRRPKLLVFEHDDWPHVAPVALELHRLGHDFRVIPFWGFMFGHDRLLTRLDDRLQDAMSVWWVTQPDEGGVRLTDKLAIFTQPAPLSPNDGEILPLDGHNGSRYMVSGFSLGNRESAWTVLPRTVLQFAPFPASHDVAITFDAAAEAPSAQNADIYFNNTRVGTLSVGPRTEVSVTIPATLWNANARAKLELRFPNAIRHVDPAEPRAPWWSAWRIWRISFRPVLPAS